jgi:uncharacterized protein (DUF433 family)
LTLRHGGASYSGPYCNYSLNVPLTVTKDDAIRIGGSRVSLESVLYHYEAGATPEQIASKLPSLRLGDIYSVSAYYLNHQESVEAYLREAEAAGDGVQAEIESQPAYLATMDDIRQRLLKRWSSSK